MVEQICLRLLVLHDRRNSQVSCKGNKEKIAAEASSAEAACNLALSHMDFLMATENNL